MKTSGTSSLSIFLLSASLFLITPVYAENVQPQKAEAKVGVGISPKPSETAPLEKTITYKPPKMGAPSNTVGGGSRGAQTQSVQIQVLAPTHTTLSSQESPTVYWYAPKPGNATVEISLTQGDDVLLEKNIGNASSGIQAISLKSFDIKLKPGLVYTLSVALIDDSGRQIDDIVGNAFIVYKPLAKPLDNAAKMAEAGYWYDAVEKLYTEKSPELSTLLKQVGINF